MIIKKSTFNPILKPNISRFLTSLELHDFLSSQSLPFHFLFPENMADNVTAFSKVFFKKQINGRIYYAFKANKSHFLALKASKLGTGVEVSSLYEFNKCLVMGLSGSDIIASGPAKNYDYLQKLILNQVLISIDSQRELEKLIEISQVVNKKVSVLIRINNPINQISRFGIEKEQILKLLSKLKSSFINLKGFSIHLNNYSITDRQNAIKELIKLVKICHQQGFNVDTIDIGGGFTINYIFQKSWKNFISLKDHQNFWANKKFNNFYPFWSNCPKEKSLERILTKKITNDLINNQMQLFIEPGRSLLDQCGLTFMKIVEIKKIKEKSLILVDGNINYLSEQWFNTDYLVDPLLISNKEKVKEKVSYYIGGNLCLENDMLSWHKVVLNSEPNEGDWLAWINTAGYQMDSNETEFHQITLPKKYIVTSNKSNKFKINFYDNK